MTQRSVTSCAIAATLGLSALTAQAQVLVGTVTGVPGDTAIAGAAILIYSGSSTVVRTATSDARGRFEISLPGAGTYVLLANHPDYADTPTSMFTVEQDNTYHVEVWLPRGVVAIEGIDVNVSIRRLPRTPVEAANQRIRENRYFGIGTHMTREEIEQSGRTELADLVGSIDPFRVRTASMLDDPLMPHTRLLARKAGKWCPLRTYVDGVHFAGGLEEAGISPATLEAVEVYTDGHQHGGFIDPGGCGLVLISTMVPDAPVDVRIARSSRWNQAGGLVAVVALLGVVFAGWF